MRTELLGDVYHYEVSGAPAAEPLLFLHGFSQDISTWFPVRDALHERGEEQVVLLDLIGHGGSARPEADAPYTLGHAVEVLEALRATLGADRLHVVGYSMGGRLALAYAVAHPEAVASLVLESASFGPRDASEKAESLERDRALAERLRASTPAEFAAWWAETPVLASQFTLPDALREEEARRRAANDTHALARSVTGSGQGAMEDLSAAAARLPMPLRYFVGERDAKYSALAADAAREWGLDVRTFPTGHNVHLEQPEAFAAALRTFYDEQTASMEASEGKGR